MALWTFTLDDWPGAAGGVTQAGQRNLPEDLQAGCNLGHTRHSDHRAVDCRRRAARPNLGLPGPTPVCADQVHGRKVAVVQRHDLPHLPRRWGYPYYPRTDALITAEPGLALMLFFADCCPVMLYDPAASALGVAHCGWRGTVAGLGPLTVQALADRLGAEPERLRAAVGPCICPACYEVGPEVTAAVQAIGGQATLTPGRAGKAHLDLLALNVLLLERAGVPAAAILQVASCTRCGDVPLYSWRRDGPRTGRLAALLALR